MPNPRPNVLLITTDQQRGDCLGLDPDGPDCLQTPNLDAPALVEVCYPSCVGTPIGSEIVCTVNTRVVTTTTTATIM